MLRDSFTSLWTSHIGSRALVAVKAEQECRLAKVMEFQRRSKQRNQNGYRSKYRCQGRTFQPER